MAHVALANDPAPRRIFRNIVGAFKDAILADDALVIQMAHDAGIGVLFISENGTAVETGWVEAMVASGCDDLLIRFCLGSSMQQTDAAPGLVLVKAIERMTGADTGFA